MRKLIVVLLLLSSLLITGVAHGQFGRGNRDWSTTAADAHRSSWVPSDPKISSASLQKPGSFAFLWTLKLGTLTTPALLNGYIGYKGFRSLGFVASPVTVFGIDTDLGRLDWSKSFPPAAQPLPAGCDAGMSANVANPVTAAFPAPPDGRGGGGGRANPAKSAVGEAEKGAAILATMEEQARRAAASQPATPPGRGGAGGPGGFNTRLPSFVYALASDGMFHSMYVSNGEEPDPPVRFLAANAHPIGLTVVGGVAYAVTTNGCGGVENGVWALDISSKKVVNWPTGGGEVAGWAGAAFGPDGTLYVATTQGSLVALDPKTLAPKDGYILKGQSFTSSPIVLQFKDKTYLAATTKDGRVHLLDTAALNGAPVAVAEGSASGSLAAWTQSDGTHWLLGPSSNAIAAWKIVEQEGAISLQSGWKSRDIPSPLPPMVINGVVFAVSGNASPVLYAMDATSGKEVWNSGTKIASQVRPGTLSGGGGQVYLGTQDGALYVFGYPLEH